MGKYFVVLNDKYLVSVEASSCGAAEHKLLDLLQAEGAVKCCQAYSLDALQTDNLGCLSDFIVRVSSCQTLSYAEFQTMADVYMNAYYNRKDREQANEDLRKKINNLDHVIADLHKSIEANSALAEVYETQMRSIF